VLIAAVIAILGTTSVFAYVNVGSDFLRHFFTGDTAYLEPFVQTSGEYAADDGFVLTVEQTLVTAQQALVIFSVEALTDEAAAALHADTFMGMDTFDFGPAGNGNAHFGGWMIRDLTERNTDTKRYFAITVSDMSNENEVDFFIRLNKMTDAQKIIIPMQTNIETYAFVLACASGEDAVLQFTPLGISLERTVDTNGDMTLGAIGGLYFRMADGEIATFNQLLRKHGIWSMSDGRVELTAMFREIVSISEFAAIILDGVEYSIADTSITAPFVPDPTTQPFELQPYLRGHLWIPLEELSKHIGASFSRDAAANTATVEYRGQTFEIVADSTIIVRNGEIIDFDDEMDATFVSEDGRLMVSSRLFDLMGLGVVAVNFDDDWNLLPLYEWMWIVIP